MQESQVVSSWQGIKDWFANHLPEVLETLNPGVDEAKFDSFSVEVEGKTGRDLPEAMKALYRQNDGQQHSSVSGIFLGLEFLSLENVREQWFRWHEFAGEDFADLNEPCSSFPKDAVQCRYACAGWIPLAFDWGGNHFGIDLTPGTGGNLGQIISFGRDEPQTFVLAPSLEAYLSW